jgi:hypothetical protein
VLLQARERNSRAFGQNSPQVVDLPQVKVEVSMQVNEKSM